MRESFQGRYCEALRSATCPQQLGAYHGQNGARCAAAIAFDLLGVDPYSTYPRYEDWEAVWEKAGITKDVWFDLCGKATTLNDRYRLSFSEIADVFEGKRSYPDDRDGVVVGAI